MSRVIKLSAKSTVADKLTYTQTYLRARWNDNFLQMKRDHGCFPVHSASRFGLLLQRLVDGSLVVSHWSPFVFDQTIWSLWSVKSTKTLKSKRK